MAIKRISYIYQDPDNTSAYWQGYTEDFDDTITSVADKIAIEYNKRTTGVTPTRGVHRNESMFFDDSLLVVDTTGGSVNIYNSDGLLTGNRSMDMDSNSLDFTNGSALNIDGSTTGWSYDFANAQMNLNIGAVSPTGKMNVRGAATGNIAQFLDNGNNASMTLGNTGEVGLKTNPNTSYDFYSISVSKTTGIFCNAVNNTNAAFYGSAAGTTPYAIWGDVIGTTNAAAGLRGTYSVGGTAGSNVRYGVYGNSRNAQQWNYAIYGTAGGGNGVNPTGGSVGVYGGASDGLDGKKYGGYLIGTASGVRTGTYCYGLYAAGSTGNAAGSTGTRAYGVYAVAQDGHTENVGVYALSSQRVDAAGIGVHGYAQMSGVVTTADQIGVKGTVNAGTGGVGSTYDAIGGEFSASGGVTSGQKLALRIKDNNGEALIGGTTQTTTEALLELQSTDKAFLVMRMTSAQAGGITAVDGMMLYVTDTDATFTSIGFWGRESGAWVKL